MNRQTKRLLQRQGQLGADGSVQARRPTTPPPSAQRRAQEGPKESRGHRIAHYLGEVRVELSKVLWPNRSEVINYSMVVLTTLVMLAALIFLLNFAFAKGVLYLFKS